MGTDIKLKDLFGQTQTEQDISTVSVPKADGTGREFYVKRPVIYYNLVASPPYAPESTEHIFIFLNLGDGPLWGDVPNDSGNCAGEVYAPIAGKTTKPIIYIQVEKYLQGVTADNTGKAALIYLYETLAGATLLEVLEKAGTADFTAQSGWGQLIQGADGQTYTYTQLTNLSGIAIGIEQPNKILNQRLFYSFLMEKTNSTVAYTATENGDYTIVPPAESSGISSVSLTVNVTGGGGDVDAYKAAIYQYGDPAGDGCAVRTVWPASGIRLDLWAKASGAWTAIDENYWHLWENIVKYHLNSDTLNSFATDLMTNLTSEFASVFEGGTKASFMDLEHVCTIPAIADSDPKTLAGLLAVLARSLDELQQSWLYDDFMSPPDYSFVFPEWAINAVYSPSGGDTVSIPFIMRPVVEDGGTRVTGYNVQTPSGTMATYETGFKSFANAEGGNPLAVGYCNTIPAYGITSELVAVIIANDASNFNVAWYSYGGQTLVNAVLQQFLAGLWTSDMGNVTLTEGWNMTAVQSGTPQTTNNLTESIVQGQLATVFPNGVPTKLVSAYLAGMDDYEKSVFLPVTTPTYKYVGKKSLQLNITLAIPENTTN